MAKNRSRPLKASTVDRLPEVLRSGIDPELLAPALNVARDIAVIEVTDCCSEENKKLWDDELQTLIERIGTYVEYIPDLDGIRIIGYANGKPANVDCFGPNNSEISIYRSVDRWIEISGITILDRPLRGIDQLVDQLLEKIRPGLPHFP